MNFLKRGIDTPIRKKSILIFFISTFTFFFSLHPISSGLGGFVFLMLGWVFPSIAVISLSVWVASFLATRHLFIFLISIPLAFLIGLNTYFPLLFRQGQSLEKASFRIDEKAYYKGNIGYNKAYFVDESIFIPQRYYGSSLSVKGDEGCMCLYFSKSEEKFDRLFRNGSSSPMNEDGSRLVNWTPEENKNRIEFRLIKQSERTAELIIDVYAEDKKTAWFRKDGIPLEREVPVASGREEEIPWSLDFFSQSWDIFIHNNVFALDGFLPNPYDSVESEANDFLSRAISS